jgi:hypothetical protein
MAQKEELNQTHSTMRVNHDDLKKAFNDIKVKSYEKELNLQARLDNLQKQLGGAA